MQQTLSILLIRNAFRGIIWWNQQFCYYCKLCRETNYICVTNRGFFWCHTSNFSSLINCTMKQTTSVLHKRDDVFHGKVMWESGHINVTLEREKPKIGSSSITLSIHPPLTSSLSCDTHLRFRLRRVGKVRQTPVVVQEVICNFVAVRFHHIIINSRKKHLRIPVRDTFCVAQFGGVSCPPICQEERNNYLPKH